MGVSTPSTTAYESSLVRVELMFVGLLAATASVAPAAAAAGAALGDSAPHSSSDPDSWWILSGEEGTGRAESDEARASGVRVEETPALGVVEEDLGVVLPCCC